MAITDNLFQKAFQVVALVGEEGCDLLAGLLVMLMVEHAYGPSGLGIFAFLLAAMFAVRYLTTFGVTRYIEIETAGATEETNDADLIAKGMQAILLCSLLGSFLLLLTAGFDSSHTRVGDQLVSYFLLALLVPVSNYNSYKFAILNGQGLHGQAARFRIIRHVIVLVAVYFLTGMRLAPSLLLAAYLLADIVIAYRMRSLLRLPKLRTVFTNPPSRAMEMLRAGQVHLFTDKGLDMLLNIDLFVLGLFVDEWKLGIYAEAAILVRCCLVISIGIRPLLRRQYALLAKEKRFYELVATLKRHGATLFSIQGILALLTLLYYPGIQSFFFDARGAAGNSLAVFLIFVPGLLFFNTFSALEPVYEAIHQAASLKNLTLWVTTINLLLTSLLVPIAGIQGAAAATMLTMLSHFFLFGRRLSLDLGIEKTTFLTAGLAFYLLYLLLGQFKGYPILCFWLAPFFLLVLYYGCGLYGVEAGHQSKDRRV